MVNLDTQKLTAFFNEKATPPPCEQRGVDVLRDPSKLRNIFSEMEEERLSYRNWLKPIQWTEEEIKKNFNIV